MAIPRCKTCGKECHDKYRRLCQICKNKEESLIEKIQKFVKYQPKATIKEIAAFTGVQETIVNRFIRESRISVAINCSNCGKQIDSSESQNLCYNCKRQLLKTMTVNKKTTIGK